MEEEKGNEEGVEEVNKERWRKKSTGKEKKSIKNFVRKRRRRIMKNKRRKR